MFTCEWPGGNDATDAAAKEAVHAMVDRVREAAKSQDVLLDYLSANFASSSQNVLGSYGAEKVKRAQEVAAKYDEEGVFQRLQNGGFLLRNMP